MSKRFLAFLMVIILVTGPLIACGDNAHPTQAPTTSTASASPTEVIPTLEGVPITPKPGDWISKMCYKTTEETHDVFQFNGIVYRFDGLTQSVEHDGTKWESKDGDKSRLFGDQEYLFTVFDENNPNCSIDKPYGWEWIIIATPNQSG